MKDWTAIAKAVAPDIPAKELVRIAPPLNALDEAFRPLVQSLTPDMEPAAVFHADEERA
jgi:hypothetical protein